MILVERADQLKPGDVLIIEVPIKDRETGREHPWKRYACVVESKPRMIVALTLKMRPTVRDQWMILFSSDRRETIYKLDEDEWPQGVVAMRMKHIATGLIKLD